MVPTPPALFEGEEKMLNLAPGGARHGRKKDLASEEARFAFQGHGRIVICKGLTPFHTDAFDHQAPPCMEAMS